MTLSREDQTLSQSAANRNNQNHEIQLARLCCLTSRASPRHHDMQFPSTSEPNSLTRTSAPETLNPKHASACSVVKKEVGLISAGLGLCTLRMGCIRDVREEMGEQGPLKRNG